MHYLKSKKALLIIGCCFISLFSHATTHYPPKPHEQLPHALNNVYFGVGLGYTNTPFSNNDLQNDFQASSFKNSAFAFNVFLGKYFNPYFAIEMNLMHPKDDAQYANNISSVNKSSIHASLFGVVLRPTWPVTKRVNLYGLAGFGMIIRSSVAINNITAISPENMATFLTGAGITYGLTENWHFNAGVEYALARSDQQQPSTIYGFAGLYYLFTPLKLAKYYSDHYIFHNNLMQLGVFDTDIFNPNINNNINGYHVNKGMQVMYQRNIFHSHKWFSFDVGASASSYHTIVSHNYVEAISLFPAFRFWIFRTNPADFYLTLIVAGPTYLTQNHFDDNYVGGQFIFQDSLDVGVLLGKQKHMSVDFKIQHYSNGGLLPSNSGTQTPLMISFGYAF